MTKLSIGCIINPKSGVRTIKDLKAQLEEGVDKSKYNIAFFETQRRSHATELAKQILYEKYDILLVCGGDGTINEALQSVIGQDILVGIIPTGSGNGLSMHTGIGRDYLNAIEWINKLNWKHVDAIQYSNKYFINLAGIGFDGFLTEKISVRKYRGFWLYVWLFIRYFWTYRARSYQINTDQDNISGNFNLIEIANGPMYGYNFEVVPGADISDGIIDLLLLKKVGFWRIIIDARKLLKNQWHKISWAQRIKASKINIESNENLQIHVDGEFLKWENKQIEMQIIPKAIKLIVP